MTNIEIDNNVAIETLQLVSFTAGKEHYGVDIRCVQEINRILAITSIPNSHYFVEGIINLRGRIIPIIDLRSLLGINKKETDKETRIIIIQVNNRAAGFVVDSVSEVLRIPYNIADVPPNLIKNIKNDFITSVVKFDNRLIMILDFGKIINNEKFSSVID